MIRFLTVSRTFLVGGLAVATVPVQAQNVEELARMLAEPQAVEAACEAKLPDGSCADLPDTRQMVLGRPAKAASAAVQSIRRDIQMSFLLGSAELTDRARSTLDRFAAELLRVGRYRPFVIEGHTDSSGDRATNMVLSQARAESVLNYLAAKGIDRSRLVAQGYGYDKPMDGRSAADPSNRRVEVVAR